MAKFEYCINKDERGEFSADVRRNDCNGETVLEIHSDEYGCIDMVTDGFMAHGSDITGLREYLIDTGIIDEDDSLIHIL